MEVKNYLSAVNAYRYSGEMSADKAARRRDNGGRKRTNTDKAEFSAAAKSGFAEALKAAAANSAESSASPERLKALSDKISDGSYSVSAEDVAASILGL
ncbi:MAG: flagellar biosynthesis anti-sigma factor FlgM [Ruminococcus sp.]|nr:flagellar biosynthesis anti-sigma factor FlgM [Ruminococcus sp.]